MGLWKILGLIFKKEEEPELTPEYIELLPASDDATFYRDSKRLLQRFDEYITSAEAETESLSIELDVCVERQEIIKNELKELNKSGSWHERHFLLKLDRLQLHTENLQQRIEIYSQNIKIYLNLIAKIQDVKAMRMNGLDEEKIETIWLEFKDTLDQYRDRIMSEATGFDSEAITTRELEQRLCSLKKAILGKEDSVEKSEPEINIKQRVPIEDVIEEIDNLDDDLEDDLEDELDEDELNGDLENENTEAEAILE